MDTTPRMNRKTVFSVVGLVLLLGVVLPFVVFIVPQAVGAEHSYVVASSSMSPAIETGDVVLVNELSAPAVEEGDIITFIDGERATIQGGEAGGNLVTHRVMDIRQIEQGIVFETKGDANEEVDRGVVPASALVGRVMVTIPYIGHVIVFAGTRLGFITLVAAPLGLLVLGELYDLARAARSGDRAANTTEGNQEDG